MIRTVLLLVTVLAVACIAAPGERIKRHYEVNPGYDRGHGGFGGYGGYPHSGGGVIPLGGSNSYSKSSASATSSSGSGSLHG